MLIPIFTQIPTLLWTLPCLLLPVCFSSLPSTCPVPSSPVPLFSLQETLKSRQGLQILPADGPSHPSALSRGPQPALLLLRAVEAVAKRQCHVTTWPSRKKKKGAKRGEQGERGRAGGGRGRPGGSHQPQQPQPRLSFWRKPLDSCELSSEHPFS